MLTIKGSRVRLDEFILNHVEPILAEWETFARQIWPASAGSEAVDPAELRDDAEAILRATVEDMRAEQSATQRVDKSHGRGDTTTDHSRGLDRASVKHGASRVESGFHLAQVIAEYRALRASVVQLWRASYPRPHDTDLDDLTRFHESMDQSLALAVEAYTERIDRSRRLFLAILGHDLRTPLAAARMTAEVITHRAGGDARLETSAGRITTCLRSMDRMIGDLLDFTSAGLGRGLPVHPQDADLDAIARGVVEEVGAAHPSCPIDYAAEGDTRGRWDAARLRQVLANLLVNAATHGSNGHEGGCAIAVRLRGDGDGAVLSVHNTGDPIPPAALPTLFDPLRRIAAPDADELAPGRAGLGLYIAHQIVTGHGGTIEVASAAGDGTTFTIHLPRSPRN